MIERALLLEWLIKSVVMVAMLLTGFAYLTLLERRLLARMQVRIGPNRAGPWGLLQPLADALKLVFKEELIPEGADRMLFILAPIVTVIPALILLAVIPFGPELHAFGRTIDLGLADDINVGILYISAITSIAVYGIVLAGWSSNNKYALMGGIRSSAQMVSYELALGLVLVGPILLAGSMSLRQIVLDQERLWYVVLQPIGFLVWITASLAEVNRAPFDMPEAEQELTAGYHVEYSGLKFALFFMAEYVKMIAVSVIGATLFLGGYWGPWVEQLPWLGPIYLFIKTVALVFFQLWVRATLPRFRYDRLMAFGWKILLPASLVNVALTAVIVVLVR
ncbi:MAG: NADH-quinone oxidoreductase subunit NuoH [Chloroflexota bacterium]